MWVQIILTLVDRYGWELDGIDLPKNTPELLLYKLDEFRNRDDSDEIEEIIEDSIILEILNATLEERSFYDFSAIEPRVALSRFYPDFVPTGRFKKYYHYKFLFASVYSLIENSRFLNHDDEHLLIETILLNAIEKVIGLFLSLKESSTMKFRVDFLRKYDMGHLDLGQSDTLTLPLDQEWKLLVDRFCELGFEWSEDSLSLDKGSASISLMNKCYLDIELLYAKFFLESGRIQNNDQNFQREWNRGTLISFVNFLWNKLLGVMITLFLLMGIVGIVYVIGLSVYLCSAKSNCQLLNSILSLGDAPLDPHKWNYD